MGVLTKHVDRFLNSNCPNSFVKPIRTSVNIDLNYVKRAMARADIVAQALWLCDDFQVN